MRNTPGHSQGEILLKIRTPSVNRASWGNFAGFQILIPSIIRFSKLPTPARQSGVFWMVSSFREKEKPGGCVAFLHAGMRIGGGPGLGGVEGSQWSFAADVGVNPRPAGERFITAKIHAPEGCLALVFSPVGFVQDVEHSRKGPPHPIRDAILICDIVNPEFTCHRFELLGCAMGLNRPQGLGEICLSSLDGNVQWIPEASFVDAFDDPSGTFSVMLFTDVVASTQGVA